VETWRRRRGEARNAGASEQMEQRRATPRRDPGAPRLWEGEGFRLPRAFRPSKQPPSVAYLEKEELKVADKGRQHALYKSKRRWDTAGAEAGCL
jgi:hypothetical protein